MKIIIKDVGYNRGYVIGPYLQERPGVNADVILDEGEDQEECALKVLHYLKSITDKFHMQANPHMYKEGALTPLTYAPTPLAEIQTDKADPASTLGLIQNAPNLEILKSFKVIASSDPTKELYNAYCLRMKELANGTKEI